MHRIFALVFPLISFAACSAPDSGALTLGGGKWGSAGGGSDTAAPPAEDASAAASDAQPSAAPDAALADGSPGTPHPDAGSPAPDAGSSPPDASPPAINAFTGAPAYASAPPATQAQSLHGFSLAGRNCFDCHGAPSPSSGILFTFAGRAFADANGATPAADVEVRVVDKNGVAVSVHSDASGYFWKRAATDLALPAIVGARTATTTRLMSGALNDPAKRGGCSACHNGTTTTYVHVP